MKNYIYNGPETQLGRFGVVKKRDHLRLMESETEGILDDERFEPVKDFSKAEKPGHMMKITPQMTGDEIKAAKDHNNREVHRLQKLAEECDEFRVLEWEMKMKTFDQLSMEAHDINRRAQRSLVVFDNDTSRAELLAGIINALRELKLAKAPAAA